MNNEKWIVWADQHVFLFCFAAPFGKPNQEEETLGKIETQRKRALVDRASDKPHSYSQNACHVYPRLKPAIATSLSKHTVPVSAG